ncbi:MAG: NAD(P)H-binding protein [Candidatus Sumerlaeia bacterium]|nr:NAD(P)H-binding protein [Candidatus Sumerlaeia bacterium]
MNITILGAGWLGHRLGARLVGDGHRVAGTTTRSDRVDILRESGLEPHVFSLDPEPGDGRLLEQLLDTDILVVSFPPGRSREDVVSFHPAQAAAIAARNTRAHAVYHVSTTGVYGSGDEEVDESSPLQPVRPSAIAVARVEEIFRDVYKERLTIVRPAGLLGWGRHGVKMMTGRHDIPGGDNPVNLVSGEDVVEAMARLINQGIIGETFNICSDEHPTRRDFYTSEAEKFGLPKPTFLPGISGDAKIVLAEKIKRRLGMEWIHPDPGMIYKPGDRLDGVE